MDSKTAEQNTEVNKEGDIIKVLDPNFNNNNITVITAFENPVAAQLSLNIKEEELKKLEEKLLKLLSDN